MDEKIKKRSIDFDTKITWQNIARMYNMEAQKYNLNISVLFVLLHIKDDGIQVSDLADEIGMEASSITRMLNNMEEKGWIVRKRLDAADRRKVVIYLTDDGKVAREVAKQKVIHFNKMIAEKVDPHKLQTFFDVIDEVNELVASNAVFQIV